MFNQKVNHFTEKNPSYLNKSIGVPKIRAEQIHNCGTTVERYRKIKNCNGLPLQTWCEPEVEVNSFAMRPIINSKEYFDIIKKYLGSLVLDDQIALNTSGMTNAQYSLFEEYGLEPDASFLQAINLEATNKIMDLMSAATDNIDIFNKLNPITEGLVVTDMDIITYRSTKNKNHFFHQIMFSVVNTTRYNTITIKAGLYQDTSGMITNWNNAIKEVEQSKDLNKNLTKSNTYIYVSNMNLLNDTTCTLGQENECMFGGFNLGGSFAQLLNDNLLQKPEVVSWLNPDSLSNNIYDTSGNYDNNGQIRIIDNGPNNLSKLIKDLGYN